MKKFKTESDFAKFVDSILEKQTTCIYDSFRQRRRNRQLQEENDQGGQYYIPSGFDDDQYENQNDDDNEIDDFDDQAEYSNDFQYIDDEQPEVSDIDPGETEEQETHYDISKDGKFLSMRSLQHWDVKRTDEDGRENENPPSITHTFTNDEEGLYYLLYQVCASGESNVFAEVRSTFSVDLEFKNYDSFGSVSYLTAGDMPLPRIFFFFSFSYALMLFIWLQIMKGESILKDERERYKGKKMNVNVRAIHHLMTALLILKVGTVFFEGVRLHYIRVAGVANIFSFVYYALTCLRGIMLFTVILLLGSGWSLVKPFLHNREKKVIFFILFLQFINNIALLIIAHDEEGERQYEEWKAILNFVDILCCCIILFPIVWQVSSLENDAESAENTRAIEKLKLFRSFYILVVSYIYFTRVVVYLVTTVLGFRHTWLGDFLSELGTLAFYVVVGYKFRPVDESGDVVSESAEVSNDEVEFLVEDFNDVHVIEMNTSKKLKD